MYSITQDGAAGMEAGTREHHSIQRRSVDDEEVELDEGSDEEELRRAAVEEVEHSRQSQPTTFKYPITSDGEKVIVVDVRALGRKDGREHRKLVVDRALKTGDQDNEAFYRSLRARFDRVGIEMSKVEVRFENLHVDADVFVGGRAMPTVLNSVRNFFEGNLQRARLMRTNKRKFQILNGISGALKPGRLTLLLGPPGSGKSTLLKALAGKLRGKSPRVQGRITYNGETLDQFVPQRTAAYVSQVDNHIAELTVRETLDFAARVLGVGHKAEYLRLLREREKAAGLRGDPETDAFLKASALQGKRHSVVTEYMLRLLGLDVCADTIVGNQMVRGISGGQRKRVTTGELVVGPMKVLFMDEISTGLDSSTTYLITRCIRNFVHMQDATVLMALLQPAPETFNLFDDVMLLSEGHIVYFGEREGVMPFFNSCGFALPARKGIADFLQEVTSRKDQGQYWADATRPYEFVPVQSFTDAFEASPAGRANAAAVAQPLQPSKSGLDALVRTKYALSGLQAFKACLRREWTLMVRHKFIYIFRTCQVSVVSTVIATLFLRTTLHSSSVADGQTYLGLIFFAIIHMMFNAYSEMSIMVGTLSGFYKQRDSFFYPAWAASLPVALLRLPYSFVESLVLSCIIYWVAGLAPEAGRFFTFWLLLFLVHQTSVALFRLMGAVGRTLVTATTLGSVVVLAMVTMGGFVLAYPQIHPWTVWVYWISPLQYAQQAVSVNEFLAARWQEPYQGTTVGLAVLESRGLQTKEYWRWIGVGVMFAFCIVLNIGILLAQTFLNPVGSAPAAMAEEALQEREINRTGSGFASVSRKGSRNGRAATNRHAANGHANEHANGAVNNSLPPVNRRKSLTSNGSELIDVELGEIRRPKDNAPVDSTKAIKGSASGKGMILPFQPMALTFKDVCYYVPYPPEMAAKAKAEGAPGGGMLQLLHNISGAFRPGVLTALVGVSGAGKTTLMDVLADRKTGGKITGDVRVDGHPKRAATFARICGYVEQNDIHSPQVTVEESLIFSAQLRLMGVAPADLRTFVNEVMELVELVSLRGALVGLPGSTGLSVEQRKRLTIAVELVANPSIIFMDEPTTGLDARAAAIVMRTVRNTVNTGRTVVCTIHQPSIDIFEAFDDLLLLKRGGHATYVGPLGRHSVHLVEYFQAVKGVQPLQEGINPATWMLEVSTLSREAELGVDFADIYRDSQLYRDNEQLIAQLSVPREGSQPLTFQHAYPQSLFRQLCLLLKRFNLTYWRSPFYNTVRFTFTIALGLIIGAMYWRQGAHRESQGDVLNIMGALFVATIFIGTSNSSTVQPVVAIERTVMYRERAAGMYAVLPYAVAQGAVELPWALGQALVYSCITYFMIYFEIDAAKFFYYLLFSYLTLIYFTFYGQMAVAISSSVQLAAVISSGFYSIWFLFAGFLIPQPRMPVWWKWYSWLDPVMWTLRGTIGSQLGDVQTPIVVEGQAMTVAEYIGGTYGFEYDGLWYCIVVLIGFCVLFWLVIASCLKFLNFQKR